MKCTPPIPQTRTEAHAPHRGTRTEPFTDVKCLRHYSLAAYAPKLLIRPSKAGSKHNAVGWPSRYVKTPTLKRIFPYDRDACRSTKAVLMGCGGVGAGEEGFRKKQRQLCQQDPVLSTL